MSLRIHDTRLGRKVPFEPIEPGRVGMYVCGVTVYDMCHLGHARVMVVFDVIYRYLRYRKFDVCYVRNFTDVDDKIIQRANELGQSCETLTSRLIQAFHEDFDRLRCERPTVEPLVTRHIPQIIDLIAKLVERGHAYESGGDVYFDIGSFPSYGGLSGRALEDMEAGASERVDEESLRRKRHPLDFVLWKGSKPGEPTWESVWGPGRPGWHIECSAMSAEHLTPHFDLHGGGQDLIFPHHENEIAQSVCGYGDEFANHWLHNGFVNVDSEKMSKSLGNFFTLRDVMVSYHPQVLRFFLLSTQYRKPINYTDRTLDDALRRVVYVYETLEKIDHALEGWSAETGLEIHQPEMVNGIVAAVEKAMDDDFNTAEALGYLSEVVRFANELADKGRKKAPHKLATLERIRTSLREVGRIFGLFDQPPATVLAEIQRQLIQLYRLDPAFIEARLAARWTAREGKDWALADEIRDELLALNVRVMDTPEKTIWKVVPAEPDC